MLKPSPVTATIVITAFGVQVTLSTINDPGNTNLNLPSPAAFNITVSTSATPVSFMPDTIIEAAYLLQLPKLKRDGEVELAPWH